MSFARVAVLLVCMLLVVFGCRKWPTNTRPEEGQGTASFVGVGSIDAGPSNVLLVLSDLDSAGYHSGSITYRSSTTTFSELHADTVSDSLNVAFTRNNVLYRAAGVQTTTNVTLIFSQPSNLQPLVLNREVGGYNMSGSWNGEMSSTLPQGQEIATMSMSQTGELFLGTVQVSLTEPWTFNLNAGNLQSASFTLSGNVSTSGENYPATFSGMYAGPDSIHGTWDAGQNPAIDRGEFYFFRSFQ